MSNTKVTVPEKLYVGLKDRKAFNPENPSLAFATPFGTDKAYQRRKATVDNWVEPRYQNHGYLYELNEDGTEDYSRPVKNERGQMIPKPQTDHGEYEGEVIDNGFTEGFTFEKSVSRWTTSNKWFTINDPRGFQLQISAENLGDIILNCKIDNGSILGKFIWARSGGNVFLCREDHPSFLEQAKPEAKRPIQVGDVVKFGYTDKATYLGKMYSIRVGRVNRWVENATGEVMPRQYAPEHTRYYNFYNRPEAKHTSKYFTIHNTDRYPVHVFKTDNHLELRRSLPKNYTILDTEEVGDSITTLATSGMKMIYTVLPVSGTALLFATKTEMLAFDAESYDFASNYTKIQEEANAYYANYKIYLVGHLGESDEDYAW